MQQFNESSLPAAIAALFRLNNYTVEGPLRIHGAEIDLVATSTGDPFASRIYIEATVEHVDNDKYGKDLGKLAMVGEADPAARRMIVSSRGFSLPVQERAKFTRIDTLTYSELFAKFERFEPYVRSVLENGPGSTDLAKLDSIYEEPTFMDAHGRDQATEWLTTWRRQEGKEHPWLIVVGEYGTGKTALTRVIQRRWLDAYHVDPTLPIPFRIELRDFTRQFDANGLLHHFLDHNALSHIPIDFVWSLIRSGRIVLLLDGYDEMAQYLSARERRVCLEALAELSTGGARGLLTSRPNYFSEAEEFHLFDVLYRNLESRSPYTATDVLTIAQRESALDEFIENQFLNRHERVLQDLTPSQTEDLVGRTLSADPIGASVVIEILRRVFRTNDEGSALSLSGKPVIISYLLDVVEQLKKLPDTEPPPGLTEWDVYTLVVDQLMLRDLGQAGRVLPSKRRQFLHGLALWLTSKDNSIIDEDQFRALVQKEFKHELRRYDTGQRQIEVENYFEDLRRSGTLSRSIDSIRPGWRFSHNSLREFLLAEYLLDALDKSVPISAAVPISDAMRIFVRSQSPERLAELGGRLARIWGTRQTDRGVGQLLLLLWDGLLTLHSEQQHPIPEVISMIDRGSPALDFVSLDNLVLSSIEQPADLTGTKFDNSELTNVRLSGAKLARSRFTECFLDGVDFSDSDLTDATFVNSALVDVIFSRATLSGTDFRGIHSDSSILVETSETGLFPQRLEGEAALGLLKYSGAETDPVDSYSVLRNHPNFPIVFKVCVKFNEHSPRQRLGIEQKGAAVRDVPFAKRFVNYLESCGLVQIQGGRPDLLYVTPAGRTVCSQVATVAGLPIEVETFLLSEM